MNKLTQVKPIQTKNQFLRWLFDFDYHLNLIYIYIFIFEIVIKKEELSCILSRLTFLIC